MSGSTSPAYQAAGTPSVADASPLILARLQALQARTGSAVCLRSIVWIYHEGLQGIETRWEIWVAAHTAFYSGPSAAEALTAAEDACI
jgi:hypothetical protein